MSRRPAGKLQIILGYAAGVGKTFRMLQQGQGLKADAVDVVIGYFESHGRQDTIAKSTGLELIPRRIIEYRGRCIEEMDTEAILARRPAVCLVDELPHTNVPGSPRTKRWDDVLVLLGAGIDVTTTMNIQHLESLNDQVREVSGVQVRETVPDWVLKRADDIVFVDLTPGALLNRLDRGVVYAPDKAQQAKVNFFREPTLVALREMALRQVAHEVDVRNPDPGSLIGEARPVSGLSGRERLLIHITDAPGSVGLIRRGRRVADYLRADCFALAVVSGAGLDGLPRTKRQALEHHLEFARKLHIDTRIIDAEDEAEALAGFAHANGITQILLSRPAQLRLCLWPARNLLVMRVIRAARDIQVTVVADRR